MSKSEKSSGALMGIIVFLLLVIVGGAAFYFGQNTNKVPAGGTPIAGNPSVPVEVTIISDKRCSAPNCDTTQLIAQLKQIPSLKDTEFTTVDYSDVAAQDLITKTGIKFLPAAIFSNNFTTELSQFLKPTQDNQFTLELGANYDPTVVRSERGFKLIDKTIIADLKEDSHIKGDKNAKIFWLEYTDLNCHYCKKMEEDGTAKTVMTTFGKDLNKATSNFIGVGGQKSQIGAEVLECIAEVSGADAYNTLMSKTLIDGDSSQANMLKLAKDEGIATDGVEACMKKGDIKTLVAKKFNAGISTFGITGTPGNVLINVETGEYEILSGAYPVADFEKTIKSLLK